MSTVSPLSRPDDTDAFRASLRNIRKACGVPIAFGGRREGNGIRLTTFDGVRTRLLDQLAVTPGAGLGGRVLASRRPAGVRHYARATTITHEYDRPVLAEGISSIIAAPVLVDGEVRGVLYASLRGFEHAIGDRTTDALVRYSADLGRELAVRDEVDRRLKLVDSQMTDDASKFLGVDVREELRSIQSELRFLAREVTDPSLRAQLIETGMRLTKLGAPRQSGKPGPRLSSRELDVLTEVALGATNGQIAERLCLSTETVKTYLRNAAAKLETRTRHEAVVVARRLGLLL
ncbi:LuxR C-terminal-related transcriptional regulator [Nocardioides sp. NPDC051685]|uniref:helix-turn-helix transcriptional regulator n=1 Tax=Nocardioides sp. NPDC051685 TaxID=3364334 RepID=UPI00379EF608